VAALAGGLLVACTGGGDRAVTTTSTTIAPTTTTAAPRGNVDGTLTIGLLLPTSGEAAGLAAPMIRGVEMAVQQINDMGGVGGRAVQMIPADEGSSASSGAAALQSLLEEGMVDAVIGPASSKIALTLIPALADSGVVTCSPSTTAIAISGLPGRQRYFRTMPSDSLQAVALARAVAATGLPTAAVFLPDDDYGESFSASLLPELQRRDVDVVSRVRYDPGADDHAALVATALEQGPSTAVIVGLADSGGALLRELREQGADPSQLPTYVSDGMRRPDLFEQVQPGLPASVAGVHGTAPAAVPSTASWFIDAFSQFAPGTSPVYAAYGFDCANLIALASLAAGTDDPAVMGAQMVAVSRNGLACRDFPSCAPLLIERRNIDLNGASGPIDFTSQGDPTSAVYDLFVFDETGRDVLERQLSVGA
jgi:branched-chain amino acid transport system substrate-binding protein